MAISNPCFEVWYLLHFQYTSRFLKDYSAVKKLLENYLGDVDKPEDVFNILEDHMEQAVHNAKLLNLVHERNGSFQSFGDPCESIY